MSIASISLPQPMPRHQLPQSATPTLQRAGAQVAANGLPNSPLDPANAAGTGGTLAGVTARHLVNLKV